MDVASARLSGSCDAMASRCAVQILPVEILRRIVGMSVDEVENRYVQLEALATVCRRWRDAIMHDGMLWNDVRVTPGTTNGQISALLRRSARCNLSLNIEGELDSSSLACAELAIGQYQRVVELDMEIDNDLWPPQITRRLTDASIWPELQSLSLALSRSTRGVDGNAFLDLRIYASHLHSLRLCGVDVPNCQWAFLGETLPNLQYLSVEWLTSAASLLHVLPNISGLRDLKLAASLGTLSANLPSSFSLPNLQSLQIDSRQLPADIISIISSNCPKLTSLEVSFQYVDMQQSGIELSSPHLMDLRIANWGGILEGFAVPIRIRGVPNTLSTLKLTAVTDDIAAMIGPSLRTLELELTDVDVERLGSAMSQCQHLERLVFINLIRSTSAVSGHPPVTRRAVAVLPRLVYAELIGAIDIRIRRLFVDLLPPTVIDLRITKTWPCPSGDDLRSVLEDILVAPTHLSLSFTNAGSFTLTDSDDVRTPTCRRSFNVAVDSRAGPEYLAILLSRPAFNAHIRLLTVGLAQAVQIFGQCAGRLPLLLVEELHVSFPSSSDLNQNALQTLVQSVPSPISCPRLKTLGINVDDRRLRAPERVTLPIALKRALVGLFRSREDDVCVETRPSVEWVE